MATLKPLYLNDDNCLVLNAGRYRACVDLSSLIQDTALNLNSPITGYTLGANSILADTDTILQAFGKTQGQLNGKIPLTGTTALSGSIVPNTGSLNLGANGATTSFNYIFSNNLSSQSTSTNLSLYVGLAKGLQISGNTRNVIIQDGGTFTDNGNRLQVTGKVTANGLGLLSNGISHTLTLGSTANGFSYYNTVDQTTNYERVRQYWDDNIYTIQTEQLGTGSQRALKLSASNTNTYTVNYIGQHKHLWFASASQLDQVLYVRGGSLSQVSGMGNADLISPIISQSGTAGYRSLWISPYEQATGSGTKLLIDAGTNSAANGAGTHTSKFSVDNLGNVNTVGNISTTNNIYTLGSSTNAWASVYSNALIGRTGANLNISSHSTSNINFLSNSTGTINGTMFGATGNWFLGTNPVDAGYKLNVEGTLRTLGIADFATTINVAGNINGSSQLQLSNNYSSGWNDVSGIDVRLLARTITNTGAPTSSTTSHYAVRSVGIPTLLATNTGVTYTSASNLYIAGPPTAGTNVTITNPYALWINSGVSYFGGSAFVLGSIQSNGVNTYLGGGSANASAVLTLNSTTKGFLVPRMTTTQKNAISSPAEGLEVYDLTLHKKCVYTGSAWETITSS